MPGMTDARNTGAPLRRVCVYCGSRTGSRDVYADAARSLALALVERGIGIVYGGASVGIMGVVADTALQAGGDVVGVLPHSLFDREVGHRHLTELIEVETMHQRKSQMAALSDAFVALPGGLGTLEELFEALTWTQIGIHAKPCGLLNVGGYFDPLLEFLDRTVAEGFVAAQNRRHLLVDDDPGRLLDRLGEPVDAASLAVEWATARRDADPDGSGRPRGGR